MHRDASGHIVPHGGHLVNLMVKDAKKRQELIASATHKQECTERNACDVELLSVGAFSPLTGFMNEDVYNHVVDNMRCAWSLRMGEEGESEDGGGPSGTKAFTVAMACCMQAARDQPALRPARGDGHGPSWH